MYKVCLGMIILKSQYLFFHAFILDLPSLPVTQRRLKLSNIIFELRTHSLQIYEIILIHYHGSSSVGKLSNKARVDLEILL